jgi:hypothetical protein
MRALALDQDQAGLAQAHEFVLSFLSRNLMQVSGSMHGAEGT